MLEKNDITILKNLIAETVDERMTKAEERLETKMETRLAETEERFETRLTETEERLETKMETRLAETEKRLEQKIEERATETENLVLEEVDRVQIHANKRFDRMQKEMDEIKAYYRARRLDDDTIVVCMKSIPDLQQRVSRLERMMAYSA